MHPEAMGSQSSADSAAPKVGEPAIRFDILTLFPEIFSGYVNESLLRRARSNGLVEVHCWDIRQWTTDKHGKVDDKPYGGGPGMVIGCQPVFDAVEAVQAKATPGLLILLTPQGERLTQSVAVQLAQKRRLLLLCGRYEGFDERIRLGLRPMEVSLGDFITNGGEVPAMAIVDSVIRLIPGVLGDEASAHEDSFSQPNWMEYPQYTRPPEFRGMAVPEILLSGNHATIARWRQEQAKLRSIKRLSMKEEKHVDQQFDGQSAGQQSEGGKTQV